LIPAIRTGVRWRLIALVQWLHDAFAVLLEEATVSRELKKLGFVKRNCLVLPSCPETAGAGGLQKAALLPALAKVRASFPAGHADRDLVPERSPRRP
jgi:hypothetical protein